MAWSKTGYSLHREELRQAAHNKREHYKCEICGASFLRYFPHKLRCKAGLCEVCYAERRYALLCKCPRIRGDTNSVYACALCPEMQHDPNAAQRLVQAAWDEIDPRKRKNPALPDRHPTPEVTKNAQALERNSAVDP